ncbi:unnamed protein product [Dimorphilus gyrociliatus]|uniref:Uncharacterized protein n=1 Tax=Dimorphilus gyrociliatus TaxID=2664684 RepID=A0A7I8WAY7_9ANNE|nr:unnamed protein product [Dimorphilus gyrociliatus]
MFVTKRASQTSRKKTIFLICLVLSLCSIILLMADRLLSINFPSASFISIYTSELNRKSMTTELQLNTSGCIITYVPIWSYEAQYFFKKKPPVNCLKGNLINNCTFLNDGFLTISDLGIKKLTSEKAKCYYRSIKRQTGSENSPIIGEWKKFNYKQRKQIDYEFIQVKCEGAKKLLYENFHTQALVKEPLIKQSVNNQPHILLISIDSISSNSLKRNMPDVVDLITKNMSAFEMKGQLKIDGPTLRNFLGLLTGFPYEQVKNFKTNSYLDKINFIWKDFGEKGYLRFIGEDRPEIGTYNYMVKGFDQQPLEYWSKPFELVAENGRLRKKAVPDTCYGETSSIKAIHNYLFDIIRVNNGSPIWAHIHQSHHVHADFNGLSSVSNDYYQFFKTIIDKGLHETSFVFFFSDHGIRYGEFRQTYVGRLEQHMPFMYVIPPKNFEKHYPEYYEALNINTKRLTTLYDLYQTMFHILHLNNMTYRNDSQIPKREGNGQSLFTEISEERSCKTAPLKPVECLCMTNVIIPKNTTLAKTGANLIVQSMNKRLKTFNVTKKCSKLKLKSILKAVQLSTKETKVTKILLTVLVAPSDGIFEVLISYTQDTKLYTIISDFSRINSYGNQSHCVDDREIKNICYCQL